MKTYCEMRLSYGETHTLAYCIGTAFIMNDDLEDIMGIRISITYITDSGSLFKIMVESNYDYGKETDDRYTSDKRCT